MPRAPRLLDEPVPWYEIDVEVIHTNTSGGDPLVRFDDGRVLQVSKRLFETRPTKRGRQTVKLHPDWVEKKGLF